MSLFDENERYTDTAGDIDKEIGDVVEPIFLYWVRKGYRAREIEYIMQKTITDITLNQLLGLYDESQ